MRFIFSDQGLALVVALLVAFLSVYVAVRDRWERKQVEFRGNPSVSYTPTTATVTVLCTNTGNRATVVRDIRLILEDGRTLATFRAPGRAEPPLPMRLDAPDERAIRLLDIPRADGYRIRRVEVELLDEDKPREVIDWPVLELPPTVASGKSDARAELTVQLPGDTPAATGDSSDANAAPGDAARENAAK